MKMNLLGIVLATSLFVGCKEPVPAPEPESLLSLSVDAVSVQYEAQDVVVSVTADGDWGVVSQDKTWVTVVPGGGLAGTSDITVKIAENKTGEVRETELVFSSKSGKQNLPVRQNYKVDEIAISDAGFKAALV